MSKGLKMGVERELETGVRVVPAPTRAAARARIPARKAASPSESDPLSELDSWPSSESSSLGT